MDKLRFEQFGIMSVNYQQYSLEYALDSIADSGFSYVDFGAVQDITVYLTHQLAKDKKSAEYSAYVG